MIEKAKKEETPPTDPEGVNVKITISLHNCTDIGGSVYGGVSRLSASVSGGVGGSKIDNLKVMIRVTQQQRCGAKLDWCVAKLSSMVPSTFYFEGKAVFNVAAWF